SERKEALGPLVFGVTVYNFEINTDGAQFRSALAIVHLDVTILSGHANQEFH
ncbi:unnamed protein product, partial [Allacma fusca]